MDGVSPDPTDAELLARMADGDQAAFAIVYDRHVGVVYGAVARFMGDLGAAEETVQDAYLAAWRRAGQYDPRAGSVRGWLLGIARNRAIDRLRAAARRPRVVGFGESPDGGVDEDLERLMAGGLASLGQSDAGPEPAALRAWERAVVRAALDAMPPLERRPLELAYDEGLTQAEVAVRLGWPIGTVKTRTRRGLAALRLALEGVPELRTGRGAGDPADTGERSPDRAMGGGVGPR